jgi:glyoxylase-like metal-dependent hydrolase (beta-lactamase superfamily II)
MKRGLVLGLLVGFGGLFMTVAAVQTQQANVATIDKVNDRLYVIKGGGGNTAAFLTAGGVVVVDTKNPGWSQAILDKIKTVTDKPVTMIINTHTHGDHVSGNLEFPATVDVVAQENTKADMERMDPFKAAGAHGLPKRTFKDKLTLGNGADQIDLFFFGPGHTNGDAWVVFPALRAMHAGDIFASKGIPAVDSANGGSVLHYAETIQKAVGGLKNVDTIVNGHSATTTTWADLKEYGDFMADFVAWAQAELKAGKTPEQAAAEWKLPEKYKGYSATVSTMMGGLAGRIQRLADEMKK